MPLFRAEGADGLARGVRQDAPRNEGDWGKSFPPKKKKKKWILIFVAVVIILSIVDNMSKDISNNKNDEKPIVNETPLWEKFDLTEDQWASFSSIFDKCGFTEIVKVEKEAPDNKGITPYLYHIRMRERRKLWL